jgi:hypothetical protein
MAENPFDSVAAQEFRAGTQLATFGDTPQKRGIQIGEKHDA